MANSCSRMERLLRLCWLLYTVRLAVPLVYTPSDAYQESLLRPYRTFSDVAIFHFTVPAQTSRAAWQFVAFMDDKHCPSQPVYIYLRHGSYPVVAADNSSFPAHTHLPSQSLYHLKTETKFQPTEMPEFHVLNPLPGSWFVIAFLQESSRQIKQQGIHRSCQYSLGSMAAWTHHHEVILLNVGMHLNITSPPQLTCFQPCIRKFGLRARALPYAEDVNVTGSDFYSIVPQPEMEAYYYIAVAADMHVGYSIVADIKDCPTPWHFSNRKSSRQPRHLTTGFNESDASNETASNQTASTLSAVSQLHEDHQKVASGPSSATVTTTPTEFQAHTAHFVKEILGEQGILAAMQGCLPMIPLTRIKHAQDFLDSFLVQGPEWFSSWLGLTDAFPVVVGLQLEPFVDIGGHTTDKDTSRHLVAIKYFPFPEPGTWFLSFTAGCFNGSSSWVPVRCELEQTIVDLRIRLQPCVFEGSPCGQHGYCQENHFRQFYFSSCHCVGGWRGWGCTDNSRATPAPLLLMRTLLLTLSNLFFLPAIVLATRRQFYTEAVVYGVTMFFSMFYHACDVDMFGFCLLRYEVLQFCDFFSAVLSFWVTLVAMANCQRTSLLVFAVPAGVGAFLLSVSWVRRCYQSHSCQPTLREWLTNLVPGVLLAAVGLVLFAFVETEDNYKYIHSAWHIVISLSISFLLPKRNTSNVAQCKNGCSASVISGGDTMQSIYERVQPVLNNDSELVDIADYRLDTDLTSLIRGLHP
ncbi:hypothetical protein MTO96_016465 [Rhipicephalus appendiculatus]